MLTRELETRVGKLGKALSAFSQELRLACSYVRPDAASSLTKSRIVLEKLLIEVFTAEMKQPPRKPMLGEMLADNQFTRKLERRIVSRMNAIRDMGNLGPHGERVEPSDAARVLEDLCEVLDWYLRQYPELAGAKAEMPASAPAVEHAAEPPAASSAAPAVVASAPAPLPPAVSESAILVQPGLVGGEVKSVARKSDVIASRSWLIGRGADCDLVVANDAVSTRHCRLTETPDGWVLEDLRSSNGTFVNGRRITGRVPLRPGDAVTLGKNAAMPWPTRGAAAPSAPRAPSGPARPSQSATAQVIHVGRDAGNEVVLDYPMVSGRHARITVRGGQAQIEDLGSTNGTFVGRPDHRITQAPLRPDDVVFFGSLRVPAARLLGGKLTLGTDPHSVVSFRGQQTVFGRDAGCDVVLDDALVSSRHARLQQVGGQWQLEDLGSTNGTFLNGRRLGGRGARHAQALVQPGDVIALGSCSFTLNRDGKLEKRDLRGNFTLEARGITVEVPGKRLIDDVSLTIFPGEFVALMGPSGAGKTTLMNALNGYTPPARGEVILNGQSLYGHYQQFAPYLGFVPQDDIIHRDLTVWQALYYTARLRLPADYREDQLRSRIADVMQQLGLEGTENVLIGSPEKKGISGGQRKRVNLAMELITDPLMLFLDEPTSGLSSEDALMVMKLLRRLADSGKTILLTIHQPSLEAFRLLDNLVVMGKDAKSREPGQLVYYGPAYPDSVGFFNPAANATGGAEPSPDEVLRGLGKQPAPTWAAQYRASPYKHKYVDERAGQRPKGAQAVQSTDRPRAAGWAQWWTLVRRGLAIKSRDTWNTIILMAQAPIIAALIVMVYGRKLSGSVATNKDWGDFAIALSQAVFLTVLAAVWFGCTNAAREIVGEWSIYKRERMVVLRLLPYVLSKFAMIGMLCFVQCLVLLTIMSLWGGLSFRLSEFLLLFLVAVVGGAVGLLISAIARTSEVAIALLPLVIVPMVIFGGLMQPIHEMHWTAQTACQVLPPRWAFEGILVLESRHQPHQPMPEGSESQGPDMAEQLFPKDKRRLGPGVAVVVLGTMLLACAGGTLLILRRRDVH